MEKCCKICKLSEETNEGAVMFQAPQEEKKRKAWSKACGVFLTKDCLVCQNHFNPRDIIESKNEISLKRYALPLNEAADNIESSPKVEDKTHNTSLLQNIKAEPTELVLVNPIKFEDISNEELDAFLDVEVEVKETPEQLFINEEQFDSVSDRLTPASSKDTSNINLKRSPRRTIVSTCGRIDFEISENCKSYKLSCNNCDAQIPIENWKLFIEHIESKHKSSDNKKDETLWWKEAYDDEENCIENADNDTQDSNFDENNTSLDESDNYEPKSKLTKKENSKLISFGRTSKDKVFGLLELVKSHAILWYRRQSVKTRFDAALKEVTKEFNTKFPQYQLTEEQIRISITRIKYLYQRITDTKHRRHISDTSFKAKFSEYFQLCDDIEAKSKTVKANCKVCGASFLEEINLQIHCYRVHNIGELPFKCGRCEQGFARASALAHHEKNHSAKTYNCEYCPRKFDQENKLHAHLRMHNGSKQICEICGKTFENAYRYRRHKLHHEPPKIKCEICGKMLYEKYTLSEHMKSHQNERQYTCVICNKTFNRQNGLAIHKRSVHKIATQYVWAK